MIDVNGHLFESMSGDVFCEHCGIYIEEAMEFSWCPPVPECISDEEWELETGKDY